MITLTVAPLHPVTVVAAGPGRYHFARLIASSQRVMIVELRKSPIRRLDVTHVVIEMFGLLGTVRVGALGIEIDCRNTTMAAARVLRLQPVDARALKIRVKHSRR